MDSSVYAILAAFGLVIMLVALVISVISIVANWKIFSKAGRPGWAVLIPIYNIYVMSDIIFGNITYFVTVLIVWVVSMVGSFSGIGVISSLAALASIVVYIVYCVKLSNVFGKSGGFAVGLVLLPVIFFPILGFGSSEYIGPGKQ